MERKKRYGSSEFKGCALERGGGECSWEFTPSSGTANLSGLFILHAEAIFREREQVGFVFDWTLETLEEEVHQMQIF